MIALLWTSGAASSVSLYLSLVTLVVVGFVFAPQEIKRDKRAVVGLVLLALGLIGQTASAAVVGLGVCGRPWWWLVIECYL